MTAFLFDYETFLEELKNKPGKEKLYEDWIKISKADRIEDEPFYEHFLQFEPIPYKIPEELRNNFDWDLLLRLVAASHSSGYHFELTPHVSDEKYKDEDLVPFFFITVYNGENSVTKEVSELWSFQILRLYEIYLEEQINYHIIMLAEKDGDIEIKKERKKKVNKYQIARIKILNEKNKIKFLI